MVCGGYRDAAHAGQLSEIVAITLRRGAVYYSDMIKRSLGKTGLRVSPIGFGGAPAGFLNTDQSEVERLLNGLLDAGINLLDTAAMYQGSEASIGAAVAHRRDEFVLVSKCGTKVPDFEGRPFSPELITHTVDRALQGLKTDRLDVMMLHSCDLKTLRQGDALAALVKARDAGKVRHIGYSGDNDAAAAACAMPEISVLETSLSFIDQSAIERVLPAAWAHDVGVLTKRSIGNGCWRGPDAFNDFYKGYVKPYMDRFAQLGLTPADLGFSGAPSAEWPVVALRFVLSQPGVHCALIGTTRLANGLANVRTAEAGPLPYDAIARLRAAYKAADPQGKWSGLT